jgi:RNA-directed DNA polymerase
VEIQSDKFNFGNRKNRSEKDAVAYLRALLDKSVSPRFILEIETSKFFNKISHEFIMNNTPICHKNVLKEWIKSGYVYNNKLYKPEEGIMSLSCGIIYGMLGNIAINGLETAVRKEIPACKIINGSRPKVNIIIFGSAIIVTGVSIAILNKVKLIIENFLISRSVAKSEIIKTRIVSIYDLPLPLHIYICRGV